jgi:hypothetical protein
MDTLPAEQQLEAHQLLQQCLHQFAVLFVSILVTATVALLQLFLPYHTSVLTGEGWVMELIAGHPHHICYELGVSHDMFAALISKIQEMGHGNSKYVSLEEQLAIFLYTCVTGLTIRHVGEIFQRSNETISQYILKSVLFLFILQQIIRYFRWMLLIFLLPPFYICLPGSDDVPHEICQNPKLWLHFKDALGTVNGPYL